MEYRGFDLWFVPTIGRTVQAGAIRNSDLIRFEAPNCRTHEEAEQKLKREIDNFLPQPNEG
jgi:hypothetical protein